MKTDDEYIQKIRRQYKRRKKIGILSIFSTLFLCMVTYTAFTKSNDSTLVILEALQILHIGDTVKISHIENVNLTNSLANTRGISTGILLGSAITIITVFFSQIIILFFGMRKEKLLIKYYELSKKL